MELFNNKENETLKFKINSEGIDVDKIEPRLVLITKENKNVLLIGEIDGDVCRFDIPELHVYEKGNHGKIKFEIISEDLYFPVWEDEFEIKTKATVKIEEMVAETHSSPKKPKISVTETKMESKPISHKPVEKKDDTLSKLEEIFEKNIPVIEEDDDDEPIVQHKHIKTPIIKKFGSF